MDRETLNQIILKQKTVDSTQANQEIKIEGNQHSLQQLLSLIDNFDFWFNIVMPNQ